MYYQQKQKITPKNNNNLLVIVSLVITTFALFYAMGQHQQANMAVYAANNNCTWYYNGTDTGTSLDYTCK